MIFIVFIILMISIFIPLIKIIITQQYKKLETEVLRELNVSNWNFVQYYDIVVTVKSRRTFDKYNDIKFFKESKERFPQVENTIKRNNNIVISMNRFLESNKYKSRYQYKKIEDHIYLVLYYAAAYRIKVEYRSTAGNKLAEGEIVINQQRIDKLKNNPSLLMSKAEYNNYIRTQQKEALIKKQDEYCKYISSIIKYCDENTVFLIVRNSKQQLEDFNEKLISLKENKIRKIKSIDSEEWNSVSKFIANIKSDINEIISYNRQIFNYYNSTNFLKIKKTCENLINSQKEFNEYISEKVESISKLFGTRVVRNETVNEDKYNYLRSYKKIITPFTVEVSSTVFASAENNPLEYVIKYFYPNKNLYPEQIQKLYHLVEELETLRDARQIIENYKSEYKQYLGGVPDYVMKYDELGFYSRLGFAVIDEDVLTVEYKFSYTSSGGMAQRSFTVPMTEENIAELIHMLENKLTSSAFVKEQRTLMTKKLRESIKARDNFTCCNCGNSIKFEPNLLLEIDHIIPVSKGGRTVEENLQTLCWKCNRAKSNKVIYQ